MTERLVTIDDAADSIGVPRAWLRREADRGAFPVVQAGRRRLCSIDAVAAALNAKARADAKAAAKEGGADAKL